MSRSSFEFPFPHHTSPKRNMRRPHRNDSRPNEVGFLAFGILFFLAAAGSVDGQVDNFDDGNDDGWVRYDPISESGLGGVGMYSFPNGNSYRIVTTPSPAPTKVGPGRAGALRTDRSYGDFYITVDIVDWDPALGEQVFGIMARLDDVGLGATDGYAFTYDMDGGDLDLTAFVNEDPDGEGHAVPVVGNETAAIVHGRHYRMVFIGVGQQFVGAIYELPDVGNPIARIEGTDISFASGTIGILNFDGGNGMRTTDVTYDNFVALPAEPPRLTRIFDPQNRILGLFWPTNASSFVLQWTPSLTPPAWNDILPPYDVTEDLNFYLDDAPSATGRYFRLKAD